MSIFSISAPRAALLALLAASLWALFAAGISKHGSYHASTGQQKPSAPQCMSADLANPFPAAFPNNVTGSLNSTIFVLPITLEAARRVIPTQYGILEDAWRAIVPDFPEGMYPMIVHTAHDHDLQFRALDFYIDDFSRAGLEFPFIDMLNDGHSSFRWAPAQLISAGHTIAIPGSRSYGTHVTPAEFDPPCDAYRRVVASAETGDAAPLDKNHYYFKASSSHRAGADPESDAIGTTRRSVEVEVVEAASAGTSETWPFPVSFFRNVTSQPTFANGSSCNDMIRIFDFFPSRSGAQYAPVLVRGNVRTEELRPIAGVVDAVDWHGAYGVQMATPFVENNFVECAKLKGYVQKDVVIEDDQPSRIEDDL